VTPEASAQAAESPESSATPATGADLADLVAVMDRLRSPGGCPWDREQTHASLAPYAVEEVYELLDAIDGLTIEGSPNAVADTVTRRAHLREELGDVLLQVVFHARVAAEHPQDPFDIDDVARGISQKLRRRHPHVFGDVQAETPEQVSRNWEQIKAAEKPERTGVLDGIPAGLPALARAQKVLARLEGAGRAGHVNDAVTAAHDSGDPQRRVGGQLLAVVLAARAEGVDADAALRQVLRDLESRAGER
jgi:XTP/dITP diphosphohydrolase